MIKKPAANGYGNSAYRKRSLSVVIPVYNEHRRINASFLTLRDYLIKNFDDYETILVDDGSKDDTLAIISRLKDRNTRVLANGVNRGKGFSVRKGMLAATNDFVLFTDADLATPIDEIQKLFRAIDNGADIAIASRNLRDSKIITKQPVYRQALGKIFPLLVRMICLRGIKDSQCGFKLFKKSAAKEVFSLAALDRYAFDVEILFIAKKKGFSIKEVPVRWIDQPYSKVNIFRDSFVMLKDLMRIRVNSLLGRYK